MKHASFVIMTCPNTMRILLQRRSYDASNSAGKWFGFGGSGEKGETPQETAKREFKEETGYGSKHYDLESEPFYTKELKTKKGKPVKIYVFIGTVDEEIIPEADRETSGWSWAGLSDLHQLDLHEVLASALVDETAMSRLAKALKQ